MPGTIKRYKLIVSGRVQGVGYRYFTSQQAGMYRLTGWVRNCYNGSVEIEAQGKKALIDRFIEELRKGPLFGHVKGIDTTEIEVIKDDIEFSIR